jgi:hypothetical protein
VKKLAESKQPIAFKTRIAMGKLWGMPIDPSQAQDHAAFLQAKYTAALPAQQPQAPMGQPTIAAPVNFGQRVASVLDR